MPFNGSGGFTRVRSWVSDAAANIKIRADYHDSEDDNFAAGLSNCVTKDGQTNIIANLPFNGFKITNLGGPPTNNTDAANKAYVDSVHSFSTGVVITGSDANGMVSFSSPTGANGLSWTGADLSWIARLATAAGPGDVPPATINRLVLNDKADGTGTDVVEVREDGSIAATSLTTASATVSGALTVTDSGTFGGSGGFGGTCYFSGDGNFVVGKQGGTGAFQAGAGVYLGYDYGSGNWTLQAPGGVRSTWVNADGNFHVPTGAFKPGGGSWSASSDARIKTVNGPYEHGLTELLALNPVRYTYKGNVSLSGPQADGREGEPQHRQVGDHEFVGLIAQEAEIPMPELVSLTTGWIAGQEVTDLRSLDSTPLIFALINAVKELSARIAALEAA